MSEKKNYWAECISEAAEVCSLTLTSEQLDCLVESVVIYMENYGLSFYSPEPYMQTAAVEFDWKGRFEKLQEDFDTYRNKTRRLLRKAYRIEVL